MESINFAPLHVQSHFSVGEGVVSPERLARAAAAMGYRALALTDSHSLAGMARFSRACRAQGIRALLGARVDVLDSEPVLRAAANRAAGVFLREVQTGAEGVSLGGERLVCLVFSEVGYRNLVRLITLAQARRADQEPHEAEASGPPAPAAGFMRPSRLSLEEAAPNTREMALLAGGREGRLWRLAMAGDDESAHAWLDRLIGFFGEENLFLELWPANTPEEEAATGLLLSLARSRGLECLAVNPARYLAPGESLALSFLRGERAEGRRPLAELCAEAPASPYRLLTPEEMTQRFAHLPEALASARALAERLSFDMPAPRRRFPAHDFTRGLDADSFLWDAVFLRARERYGDLSAAVKDRLNREFDHWRRAGLCNALVFLCRLGEEMDRRGVMRAPGAGPLTTSLIASLLGLTRFDPLRFGIEFHPPAESETGSFPVFQFTVPSRRRALAIECLRAIYAGCEVARIGRWETWDADELLEALVLWTGLPLERVEPIRASAEWREAVEAEARRPLNEPPDPAWRLRSPQGFAYLARRLAEAPRRLAALDGQYALMVDGLTNVAPLEPAPAPARGAQDDGSVGVAQLESDDLDRLTLARLEIRADPLLDLLDRAAEWVQAQERPGFHLDHVTAEDARAFQTLGEGWTTGLPPLDSPTAKSQLRARRPKTFEEFLQLLADLPALRRPRARAGLPAPEEICLLALMLYAGAWMKAHYPAAFFAAALTQAFRARHRFRALWREARRLGLNLLPPDVNLSEMEFSCEGPGAVRCGLMVINGLGPEAFEEIATARRGLAFFDLADFVRRVDPGRVRPAVVENLIRGGACDGFGLPRLSMLRQAPIMLGAVRPRERRGGGAAEPLAFFDRPAHEWISEMTEGPEEDDGRPESLSQRVALERQATGFGISADPLQLFADLLKRMEALTPWQLTPRMDGRVVRLAGYIEGVERGGPLAQGDVVAALDLSGVIALVPEALKPRLREIAAAGGAVIFTGLARWEGNEWRLRAESMESLQAIWEQTQSTERVTLDLSHLDRGALKTTLKTLRRFPGQTPVEVISAGEESRRLLAQIAREAVMPCPPLEEALERLLGAQRVITHRRETRELLTAATGAA